jgi:hypothetical protein
MPSFMSIRICSRLITELMIVISVKEKALLQLAPCNSIE